MKGSQKIHHRPYIRPNDLEGKCKPYICRLAPFETGFTFEWLDNFSHARHKVFYGIRGEELKHSFVLCDFNVTIDNLKSDTDYEFYVESADGTKSNIRLVHTGALPKDTVVINYLHPEDKQYEFSGRYLCSPSIARVKSGKLIASMDVYGAEMAQNLMILFYSEDDGASWHYLTDLYPFYWGYLFTCKDVLYVLGFTTEYGNLQIACSHDEGNTWSAPVTLFYGSNYMSDYGGCHRAPMHFTEHKGRMYTSMEYGCWKMHSHLPGVLSMDANADPMIPENWTMSNLLPFEGKWKEDAVTQADTIEGNMVVLPDGNLYNIMRWKKGEFLKLRVNTTNAEAPLQYVSIDKAPVSNSMFRIIPHKDKYILVTNRINSRTEGEAWSYRNILSIYETVDFKDYTFISDIVSFEDQDPNKHGVQYPAFIKEEDTLYLSIRSAFNNADDFHNSNYMLFAKVNL